METAAGNSRHNTEEHSGNSVVSIPGSAIYSYNMDDSKTPGGLKVPAESPGHHRPSRRRV
jgi:hypothetical protein